MSFTRKLMQYWFNYAYNPVYDFTTARLNRYRKLQERCVGKLEFEDNDRVLCVGLGTGNEVFHILQRNRNVNIIGVDYSKTALRKAYKKALMWGKEIDVLFMDARHLEFAAGSFDKVVCLHVMDFVEDTEQITDEILRVLKAGGQYTITYPSDKEGPKLGLNLLKDSIRNNLNSGKHRIRALAQVLAQVVVGTVYLPLIFRPKRKSYSSSKLEAMFAQLTARGFQIEEESVYQDFIVYGRKLIEGGK